MRSRAQSCSPAARTGTAEAVALYEGSRPESIRRNEEDVETSTFPPTWTMQCEASALFLPATAVRTGEVVRPKRRNQLQMLVRTDSPTWPRRTVSRSHEHAHEFIEKGPAHPSSTAR